MFLSKSILILFASLMIANNVYWLYLHKDTPHQSSAILDKHNLNDNLNNVVCDIVDEHTDKLDSEIDEPKTVFTTQQSEDDASMEQNPPVLSAQQPTVEDALDIDVPKELSQNTLYKLEMDNEHFFSRNTEEKLGALEVLPAHGDGLDLIDEILSLDDDHTIRATALRKLNQVHSYAATNILITALEDPVPEVSLTALDVIRSNGDRSLLPVLKEKMAVLPMGHIREHFERSIQQLEYSAGMGMDATGAE